MGSGQVAPDPAVDAEVHEGGKRPDVFAVGSEVAELSSHEAAQHIKGQRGPLAVPERGKSQQNAAQNPGNPSPDYAQQHGGFEGQIARNKALVAEPDPDAQ